MTAASWATGWYADETHTALLGSGNVSETASEDTSGSSTAGLWQRIKDHKVLQWSLAYLGAALAIAHGAELLGHAFHWPELANRLLLGTLIVGVPVVLALAWYHGHRSLRSVSFAEAMIISLLVVIGAGLLVVLVPSSGERGSVESTSAANATSTARGALPVSLTGPSIAVLPFLDMSPGHDQEYFSDGLAEELINQLSQLPDLRVIGRASSFTFKGKNEDPRTIGESLGVNHILEGSVRKAGDRLRITTQLINPRDGTNLWSATYERSLGDIFAIQEDIARTVASTLRVPIGARDLRAGGTSNLEAYDAFLRALSEPSAEAIPSLQRAVELDPRFTAAWMNLVLSYGNNVFFDPSHRAEWEKKMLDATNKVLELAPGSPEANFIKGYQELSNGRFAEAETLFVAAQQLPASFGTVGYLGYGDFLMAMGRAKDALEVQRRAVALDPVSIGHSIGLQIDLEILSQYEEAEKESRRAQGLSADQPVGLLGPAILRAMGKRDKEAMKKLAPQLASLGFGLADINQAMAALLDDPSAALARLRQFNADPHFVRQTLPIVVLAQWAAYFGDPAFALEMLRGAPHKPPDVDAGFLYTLWRPVVRDVRRLPAFKDFVRELGLVDYWRTTGNWGDFCRPVGQNDFTCT
jgi:TolB-like protein/Flp pilus assembly protein TadD